jgi:hypothetical protein
MSMSDAPVAALFSLRRGHAPLGRVRKLRIRSRLVLLAPLMRFGVGARSLIEHASVIE